MISTIPGADICHDGFGSLALDYASKEGPRCEAAKKAEAGPLPAMGDEVVTEFTANEGKLDPTMNPTLTMMDKDGSNSVDQDEWSAAAKQKLAIAKGCKASDKSWCPCQNNPDDPEC